MVHYDDVILTIRDFFIERLGYASEMKIPAERSCSTPGWGILSVPTQNTVLKSSAGFQNSGIEQSMLIGPSRKSFLAKVSSGIELSPLERDFPCAAVCSIGVWKGKSAEDA
ncbi:MAG: hypothetical protein Ct9H90mP8_3460 [Pseudomonadota bacterium]|nr:MAG: hypothetical protein Ct9H90mP8_3460 [Pseudomonadota bacterium]